MKRLLKSVLAVALCVCCTVPFAGCGDGWEEIQSITYTTDAGKKTLYSLCDWKFSTFEYIEQSEYDNAPSGLKKQGYRLGDGFPERIDRKNFETYADSFVGKTYYCLYDKKYYKTTILSYKTYYVKVKKISEKTIEIDYKDKVTQVSVLSYEITYFKN